MSFRFFGGVALTLAAAAAAPCVAQSISFVTGDSRPTGGNAMVRILGSDFTTVATCLNPVSPMPQVFFGGSAGSVLSFTPTFIVCLAPAGEGTRTVTVVSTAAGGGTSNGFPYTYDAPVVNAMSPATGGPIAGNFTLAIGGANFGTSPTVSIGGVNAPVVTADHTLIQCTVPPGVGTDKPVIVTVGGPGGQSSSASGPKFAYAGPTIQGLSVNSGPASGGTVIDIQGVSLGLPGNPLIVTIGGLVASVVTTNVTLVQVQTPSGVGTNLPVVLTRAGQSSTAPIPFSYAAPLVTNVNPPSGATGGGNSVVITGSNFGALVAGQSSVSIGNVPAAVSSWTNNSITATVPAGQGANRPVIVTAGGQSSTPGNYSYNAPVLTIIRNPFGPAAGGTPVTIDGQNFGTTATVAIGGLPATVIAQSHTSLTCIAPTRSGTTPLSGAQVVVTVSTRASNPLSYAYLCAADFNHSGGLEVQDIFDYLSTWFNGCP